MNPFFSTILLTVLLLVPAIHVTAQSSREKEKPKDQEPEIKQKITVTATRGDGNLETTPRAVSIVDRSGERDGDPGLSLNEIVRATPGIVVQQRANPSQGDRVTIRGMGARASFGIRGVKVLLDGIPLTTPDGQTALDNVDIDAIGSAEILPGPASSLYGNSAGGILDLRTARQRGPRFFPVAGSDGLWVGKFQYGREKDRFDFSLGGSYTITDGYRDYADAAYSKFHATGSGKINDRLHLRGVLHVYDAPYLLNPGSLSKDEIATDRRQGRAILVERGASKKSAQELAGLTFSYRFAGSFKVESTLYGVKRSLDNPILPRIIDLARTAGGWRNTVHGYFMPGGQTVRMTAGIDLEIQRDQRTEFENLGLPPGAVDIPNSDIPKSARPGARILDQKESIRAYAPFVEWTWTRGDWSATLGGRYDRYQYRVSDRLFDDGDNSGRRSMSQFSPMLGLSYHPGDDFNIYANRATAFQTPTANELSNRPDGLGGFNEELEPEKTRGWELGLRGKRGNAGWSLALYRMNIEEMILPRQGADEETFFQNAGEVQTEGLEFQGRWRPYPSLLGVLAYTRTDTRFQRYVPESGDLNLSGNRVPGVPPHRLDTELQWHGRGYRVSMRGRWEDEYFADDRNISASLNERSVVADLRLVKVWRFRRGSWTAYAGVDNVFDTKYNGSVVPNAFGNRYFEPAAGRTWTIGLGFAGIPRIGKEKPE